MTGKRFDWYLGCDFTYNESLLLKKFYYEKEEGRMTEINNCENCHHFNELIHWEEGLFYQCMMGNKLWEKCNDYDAIKELEE